MDQYRYVFSILSNTSKYLTNQLTTYMGEHPCSYPMLRIYPPSRPSLFASTEYNEKCIVRYVMDVDRLHTQGGGGGSTVEIYEEPITTHSIKLHFFVIDNFSSARALVVQKIMSIYATTLFVDENQYRAEDSHARKIPPCGGVVCLRDRVVSRTLVCARAEFISISTPCDIYSLTIATADLRNIVRPEERCVLVIVDSAYMVDEWSARLNEQGVCVGVVRHAGDHETIRQHHVLASSGDDTSRHVVLVFAVRVQPVEHQL
jgi:hypothetical protein